MSEETLLMSEHHQKMRKLAKSCGGFYLIGWVAKLAVWSRMFLYAYFCVTLMWFVMC